MSFWDFFWLMIWSFFFIMYLMVLFQILFDIFRDSTLNGFLKAIWVIALLIVPVITALIYLISRGDSMNKRNMERYQQSRAATDDYIRTVASSGTDASAQIANAKALLDSGAISQAEYDQLKAKALA